MGPTDWCDETHPSVLKYVKKKATKPNQTKKISNKKHFAYVSFEKDFGKTLAQCKMHLESTQVPNLAK